VKNKESKPKGTGQTEKQPAAAAKDAAPKGMAASKSRLREHYQKQVVTGLVKEFGYKNPMAVPKVEKVSLNIGLGEATGNSKLMDGAVSELSLIAGQKPVVTKAKKAISNFAIRAGVPLGASVTLRGARMWEFLDRFISIAVPRIRDFRGLPTRSFDGRGNYTIGLKEQMVFPEIDFDKVERIHGMDITIVTDAGRDDVAMALLRELGVPFAGEQPAAVA